jgi:16S rRNA G966 N2-methylase RsmD
MAKITLLNKLFGNLDFKTLANNPDFKESSVRAFILDPLIRELGYTTDSILLEKSVQVQSGSKKNRQSSIFADYALKVGDCFSCVIEAKAPDKSISDTNAVEQAFSYASHSEIRANFFALCNGLWFDLYRTDLNRTLLLHFPLAEIDGYFNKLRQFIAPECFLVGKDLASSLPLLAPEKMPVGDEWYRNRPLLDEIPVKKQAAKRHFGCNAYFTRQTWNVVQGYIKNFTRPGDMVLDPFGGSGVTLVEALMTGRKAIHIDLNPLSPFMVKALIAPVKNHGLLNALAKIKNEYERLVPKDDKGVQKALKKYKIPKALNLPLPKNADVGTIRELFTDRQVAELALLKHLIRQETDENIRESLLLAFYNTITVCNLTFHETPQRKGLGGHHFGFYYRYRMAYEPIELPVIEVFEKKVKRVYDGKLEMAYFINEETISNAQIRKGTATDLSLLPRESIDYIYTDPPYGKKIQYLDLSAMWNAWLDLKVSEEDFEMEAIEGGEHNRTKDDYNSLIAKSIREMYRVLKFDRWLSFVFAHKDPEFWHLIIDTAESVGFEYAGAVPQKNGQTSFKKRQNPFTVLSGQLIINFRKVRNPRAIMKANLGMNISEIVMQTIEGIIAKYNGASLEQINDELIIKGLELGFLDLLKKEYTDLTPLLMNSFDYDSDTELYTIRRDTSFTTHIPLDLRIKYYLTSYLRRMEIENRTVSFDEIVLHILPLLKNGNTPENQNILNVLEIIGERVGEEGWRLKRNGQKNLFGDNC